MSLVRLPADDVEAIASKLTIADKATGASLPWVVTAPQRKVWHLLETGGWYFFTKPRQAFFTTAIELDDVLWCWANDAMGNRVRCAFVIHTADATVERAEQARSFIEQLGIDAHCTTDHVLFPNRSELVFITAGTRGGAGRSGSFQRAHLSELPFWPAHDDPLAALLPTLSDDGQVVIETTLDMSQPSGPRAKKLWRDKNRYEKVFVSLEENPRYRADPRLITDEEWARLSTPDRGFTDRGAAAWWQKVAVPDLCTGDESRAKREFPQREEDMFTAGSGRWVPVTPVVTPVHHYAELKPDPSWPHKDREGMPSGVVAEIRRPLAQTSMQLVAAIDIGKGVGRDFTVVVIIDKRDNFVCASLASNQYDVFEFARLAAALLKLYSIDPVQTPWLVERPGVESEVVVEENGIGEAMVLKLRELGVSLGLQWTSESSKIEGLTLAKQAIVRGEVFGPAELADECDELHQNEKGEFVGRKDMLMAVGFALIRIRQSPYDEPTVKKPAHVVDVDRILEARMRRGTEW